MLYEVITQGNEVALSDTMLAAYEAVNQENSERLRSTLEDADFVV